jgi:hypothetical protein
MYSMGIAALQGWQRRVKQAALFIFHANRSLAKNDPAHAYGKKLWRRADKSQSTEMKTCAL